MTDRQAARRPPSGAPRASSLCVTVDAGAVQISDETGVLWEDLFLT